MLPDFEQRLGNSRESAERLKTLDLKGSVVPLITPRDKQDPLSIDREGLARLIEFQISGGTNVLFILGTTGEFRNLTLDQKKIVIETSIDVAQGRIPVIVGVSAPTVPEVIRITKFAQEKGADGVVIAPLYGDTYPITRTIAASANIDRPKILYNNPSIHNNVSLLPEFLEGLPVDIRPNGIKDSSSDFKVFSSWLKLRSEQFRVFAGTYPSFKFGLEQGGIDGWVLAEANYSPQSFSLGTVMPDGKTPDESALSAIAKICQPEEDFIKATKQKVYETGLIKSPGLFP